MKIWQVLPEPMRNFFLEIMVPDDNNRWIYSLYGLEKPVDGVPGTKFYLIYL